MEALKITPNQINYDEQPAEQAGVFLGRVSKDYDLFDPRVNQIAEAAAKTVSLEKAGRYIGTIAGHGSVTIIAMPDELGRF